MRLSGVLGVVLVLFGAAWGDEPATGLVSEVPVRLPTRLDWEFVAGAYGPEAARLTDYDSDRQRYELFVPPAFKPGKTWPLVVFVSPGDDPLGWRSWEKVCEDADVFFCAAYGAGNGVPPGRRVRIVLDMLDDVRRRYPIDPARTYVAGFDGGATVACTLAFALPEHFGGVLTLAGGDVQFRHDYLRQRARDRLSVAVITGADDPQRRTSELYLQPLLSELGIRARLWLAPRTGHEMPPSAVLTQAYSWLEEDLPRRRQDEKDRPKLAVGPDEAPTRRVQAERAVAAARADLRHPERTYRGAALLLGVVSRWDKTDAADEARELLARLRADPEPFRRLAEQGGKDERQALAARARALERLGQTSAARQAWETVSKLHPGTPEAEIATTAVERLTALRAATPYLGVQFEGQTTVVQSVVPHGPAARAGLRKGDQVRKVGEAATASLADLRGVLKTHKPGDRLPMELTRAGRDMTVTIEIGSPP